MGVQAVGNLVEDAGVFVVGDQAVADDAVLIADIEPNAVASVLDERAVLQDDPTGQTDLVATRFPASIESLGVVVADGAVGQVQAMGPAGAETELAVVLERAVADGDVFASELGATAVGVLEHAIRHGQMIPGQFDGSLLRPIGGVAEVQALDRDVIALDLQYSATRGGLDQGLLACKGPVVGRAGIESFGVEIDEKRSPSQLVVAEDLPHWIRIDEDLLAAPDETMELVVRMGVVFVPRDEPVRPVRDVDMIFTRHLGPIRDVIRPRQDDLLALGCPDDNRCVFRAILIDPHVLAIDPGVQ